MNFENTRNQAEKAKKNGGFSLVELIIVIAIMAVLVGVLTPAYLKYVDSARQSADVQSFDAIISAMEVVAIDPSVSLASGERMIASFGWEDGKLVIKSSKDKANESLKDLIGDYTLKTPSWKGIEIEGKMSSDGKIVFSFISNQSAAAEIWEAGNFGSKVTKPAGAN